MKICEYGCGKEGKYQFKNGRWCCEKTFYRCLAFRKRMSEAHKGKIFSKEHKKNMSKVNKGKKLSKEHRKKMSEAHKGKTLSKEHKKKLRLVAINRIEKNKGQVNPNYNPEACKFIEEYGVKNGYDFQHAENGGEFNIKELGYWIDGYDKEKNVVIEIDEPHHYDFEGNLNIKDKERQQEIIDFLGCEFIRMQIN